MYFDEAEPKIDYTCINNYRSSHITIFIIRDISTSATGVLCITNIKDHTLSLFFHKLINIWITSEEINVCTIIITSIRNDHTC